MNTRTVPAVAAIAVLALVTACNSNKTAAGAAANTPSSANVVNQQVGSGPMPAGASSAGAGAKAVDLCALVDAATAARLTGQPYTTAVRETGDWTADCSYDNDDSTIPGVNVVLYSGSNVAATWNLVQSGNVTKVSGVGDKAVWDNDNSLFTMWGALLMQVNGLTDQAKAEALAKAVIAAMQ